MTAGADFETLVQALGLPPEARVEMRVPKKLLIEQGAPTAADKRVISDGIEELQWFAACKPTTIGVPDYRDDVREYLEIAVVGCDLRPGAKAPRLIELIHRAIPYPVILITRDPGGLALSLAHKRWAEREAARIVIEDVEATGPLTKAVVDQTFIHDLSLANLPRRSLFTVYQGWITRVQALHAARLSGAYDATDDQAVLDRRRAALDTISRLTREGATLRAKAAKEKQMNRRVDLNLQIQRLEAAVAAARKDL